MDEKKLKPCPFCGSEVTYLKRIKIFCCKNYKGCGAIFSFSNTTCNNPWKDLMELSISEGMIPHELAVTDYRAEGDENENR